MADELVFHAEAGVCRTLQPQIALTTAKRNPLRRTADGIAGSCAEVSTADSVARLVRPVSVQDGYYPSGSLILDSAGNLYGTTTAGTFRWSTMAIYRQ